MDKQIDVISMDLPEYEEEYSPFPDVKTELPFAEGKEEVYRRNRLIAAEEQAKLLAEEEKKKADKKAELENMYIEAEEAVHRHRQLGKRSDANKKSAAVLKAAIAALAAIVFFACVRPDNHGESSGYSQSKAVQVSEPDEIYGYVDSLECSLGNIEVEQHLEKLEFHSGSYVGRWDMTVRFTVKNNGRNTVGITPADFIADFDSYEPQSPETGTYGGTMFIVNGGEQAEFTLTYSDIKYPYKIGDSLIAVLSELKGFYYGDSYIEADSELLEDIEKVIVSSEP